MKRRGIPVKVDCERKVKRVVIPLTLILTLFVAIQAFSVLSDVTEKAKDGDVEGVTEVLAEEAVEEAKDEIIEPFWILLIRNPLVWLLGIVGTVFGIKFVIK